MYGSMARKYKRQLSTVQIELLRLVVKFRFASVEILSDWNSKSKSTIYERLAILEHQGYIQKRYEKNWKLLGKPALYSVTGKGMRAVSDNYPGDFTDAVIRNQYKNKTASLQLMDSHLDIARLSVQLNKQYDSEYSFYSKSELDRYEGLLRPLPDLYVVTDYEDDEEKRGSYQLEVLEAGLFTWMLRKRITAHQKWLDCEDGDGWPTEDRYPTLLLVCSNNSTEKRIHRLTDDGIFDFEVWTVTRERLASGKKEVWIQYYDYDKDCIEYLAL